MFVQFSDKSKSSIVSIFANKQDDELFPNQGELPDDHKMIVDFLSPPSLPDVVDPVEKLMMFLKANPDVAEILK